LPFITIILIHLLNVEIIRQVNKLIVCKIIRFINKHISMLINL